MMMNDGLKEFFYFLWYLFKQPFLEVFKVVKLFVVSVNRPKFLFWIFLSIALFLFVKDRSFSLGVVFSFVVTLLVYFWYEFKRGDWKHELRERKGFYKKQSDDDKGVYE